MPDFPAYARDELEERARNLLRTRRRGIDVTRFSDYDLWARILAALAWGEQKRAEGLLLLLDPRRAFGGYLEAFARDAGIGREITEVGAGATYASGKVILLATPGSGPLLQPADSILRHRDGTEFTLDMNATTSAAVDKTLYAGHLSSRSRIYQGHLGDGPTSALAGEVYLAMATGEYAAVKNADNHAALSRHLVDWYIPLDRDPALHDAYVLQQGVVASVTATKPGARGNKESKDTLTVVSPTGGVLAEAFVVSIGGGRNAMTPAELQDAVGAITSTRAPMGTLEEIRQVALACPDVLLSECFVAPAVDGLSSYALLPVRPDGAFVGAADRAALLSYVSARFSPVDRFTAVSVYEELDTRFDVLTVQVSEIYRPDWQLPDESEVGITIADATVDAVTIEVDAPIAVGDRVIITERSGSAFLVVRRVVESVAAEPAGSVLMLDAPLPYPPTAGEAVLTPGGALAEGIVEALYAAYAARGPSAGGGGQVRYPAAGTSDEPDAIASAVSRLEGVLDAAYRTGEGPDMGVPGGVLVPQCVIRMYA